MAHYAPFNIDTRRPHSEAQCTVCSSQWGVTISCEAVMILRALNFALDAKGDLHTYYVYSNRLGITLMHVSSRSVLALRNSSLAPRFVAIAGR